MIMNRRKIDTRKVQVGSRQWNKALEELGKLCGTTQAPPMVDCGWEALGCMWGDGVAVIDQTGSLSFICRSFL